LVRILVTKGVITADEARVIVTNASPAEQRDRLAVILRDKGVISAAEFEATRTNGLAIMTADYKPSTPEPSAPPPPVIAAVAPVRLLGIDAPKREGLIPDIKLGTGVRLKFYGIFKTSIIHD